MKTATWQETFDHTVGSGALDYSWWLAAEVKNPDTAEWELVLTGADDLDSGSEDGPTVTITHSVVMKTAREIIKEKPKYASDTLVRECRNLVFDADETDFDANSADELLQVIVFGEVVYG